MTRAQFPRATTEPLATAVPLGDTWLGTRRETKVALAAAALIASLISLETFPISCSIRQAHHQLQHQPPTGGWQLPRLISQLLIHGSHINILIIE